MLLNSPYYKNLWLFLKITSCLVFLNDYGIFSNICWTIFIMFWLYFLSAVVHVTLYNLLLIYFTSFLHYFIILVIYYSTFCKMAEKTFSMEIPREQNCIAIEKKSLPFPLPTCQFFILIVSLFHNFLFASLIHLCFLFLLLISNFTNCCLTINVYIYCYAIRLFFGGRPLYCPLIYISCQSQPVCINFELFICFFINCFH
jgi:ABC-type Na+ efflux pump permease subunit